MEPLEENIIHDLSGHHKFPGNISLVLVLSLLNLKIGMSILYLLKIQPAWIIYLFQVTIYSFTALLIWQERNNLAKFHINRLALLVFFLFRTILWASYDQSTYSFIANLFFTLIAILLLFGFIRSKSVHIPKLKIRDFGWFGLGSIIGVAFFVLLVLIMTPTLLNFTRIIKSPSTLIISFIYVLGNAGVDEEPLFRGFLWGYLREFGWKEIWICLLQAVLFGIVHLNYLDQYSFWISIPLLGFILGLLSWKSRSIATSMAAHAGYGAIRMLGIFMNN